MSQRKIQQTEDAIFLYFGILEAYKTVGEELLGEGVVHKQVIPRMGYYIESFLPELQMDNSDLKQMVDTLWNKIDRAIENPGTELQMEMEDAWKLRAVIFGFENAFLEILGDQAIKEYVFNKITDYLVHYLPPEITSQNVDLNQKLEMYLDYLKTNGFIKAGKVKIKQNQVEFSANHCAFAKIHDSPAYRDGKTRYCPWGMIANSILVHHNKAPIESTSTRFTTRGSITYLKMLED